MSGLLFAAVLSVAGLFWFCSSGQGLQTLIRARLGATHTLASHRGTPVARLLRICFRNAKLYGLRRRGPLGSRPLSDIHELHAWQTELQLQEA